MRWFLSLLCMRFCNSYDLLARKTFFNFIELFIVFIIWIRIKHQFKWCQYDNVLMKFINTLTSGSNTNRFYIFFYHFCTCWKLSFIFEKFSEQLTKSIQWSCIFNYRELRNLIWFLSTFRWLHRKWNQKWRELWFDIFSQIINCDNGNAWKPNESQMTNFCELFSFARYKKWYALRFCCKFYAYPAPIVIVETANKN